MECSLGTGWNSPGEGNNMSKDPEALRRLSGLTMGHTGQSGWNSVCVRGTVKR